MGGGGVGVTAEIGVAVCDAAIEVGDSADVGNSTAVGVGWPGCVIPQARERSADAAEIVISIELFMASLLSPSWQ